MTVAVLMLTLLVSLVSVASTAGLAQEAADTVTLTRLQVEKKTEPVGIDVDKPRFSWVIESDARGVEQESYRLRVVESPGGDAGQTVWDSGVVSSDESANVPYAGPDLSSGTRYAWRVDVVTNVGSATASSHLRTGFYSEADWGASKWIGNASSRGAVTDLSFDGAGWIWTPEQTRPVAPAEDRAFRTTRETPAGKTATGAEVLITADDSFRLWVNGRFVGATAGANNEWQQSHLYEVPLEPQRNVFAVRTTNGPGSPAGLIAVVRMRYSDGTTSTFTTGTDWKASKTIAQDFFAPGFDDSSWGPAVAQAQYGGSPWGRNVRPPKRDARPAPLLRKEFDVGGAVRNATVYVAAGGYADVSLNGGPISDDVLSPGFTDYDDTVQYVATDVTDRIRSGRNALAMELGRGFYGMTGGNVWRWESPPWHDEPVVRAVLRVEYEDGSTEEIVTDESWKIHDGPTVFDDLYAGETYDARLVQDGYDSAGFDDGSWAPARLRSGPRGVLVNQRQQPIRVTESLPAVDITEPVNGTYVVKFPRVLAGWVEFDATGPAGTTIRAQYGEKLKADGLPDFSNNGGFQSGFQTDRFVLAGTGGSESWEPRFSYKGFQYIQVTGWPGDEPPPLDAFTAKVVHTAAAETGSFESSSDIMNRTHRAVVDTLRNNIHGIPTDTPMFEKNGWTGDAAVGAEIFMLNLDTHELFAKWMRDVHETRDAQGAPMVIAPSSGNWGEWGVAPPWHSAYVLIPQWLYQYGGDRRVLEDYYDGMKRYVDLEFDRSQGGIVANPRLGDWVSPEASPAGGNAPEDIRVSGTAYLYAMLTSMERSADLLGRPDDAAHFAARAAKVKSAFNDTFLDRERGLYRGNANDRGYRQTHNVLALAFGLAPDEQMAQRVADSIAADVEARGNKLNTGVLGTKYLLPVLTDYGHEGLAYKVATQTEYPSWGYMIENGATTMWEHWALDARSRGHYFLGTVEDWFYKDVAGIQASERTGYRDIAIAPAVTEQMDRARATTQTPFGPVSSDWRREGDRLRLDVDVPVGSKATVRVPAENRWAVSEGGKPVTDADGVAGVRAQDGAVLVEVGSGRYSFEVDRRMGEVGAIIDRLDELDASIERLRDSGQLGPRQADRLRTHVDRARSAALPALERLRNGGAVGAARQLTSTLDALDDFGTALRRMRLDEGARTTLAGQAFAARRALGATISDFIGVSARASAPAGATKPGDVTRARVTMSNGGSTTPQDVRASVRGLPPAWRVSPDRALLAERLPGGSSAGKRFAITVPRTQLPGDTEAWARVRYRFDGSEVLLRPTFKVEVDSPVIIESTTVDPATSRPGESARVRTVLRNDSRAPVTGRLDLEVPEGWGETVTRPEVRVPAGGQRTVDLPVSVPRDAEQAVTDVRLDASFTSAGGLLAAASTTLRVEIDPAPGVAEGYDHIDLGDGDSERAHALSASPASGTSPEAGLTRRYAGHLTPYSFFEFDMSVRPGQPFVLRAVETYDRAQTKRYKIYVDGQEVRLRSFRHESGAGTETYEYVVPGELAKADTVRIKLENQDDPAFYDPSIADVWTRPTTD